MTFPTATPAERAALVRMVSASARLIVVIGRLIVDRSLKIEMPIDLVSEEFADAIKKVSETSKAADRESFR